MAAQIEDESRARIVREVAEAIGDHLVCARLVNKQIWQLRMPELERMAEAAVSAFIVAQGREEKRRSELPPTPPPSDFVD